jgi:trans-4-hydroxy-L-proline dehydratase
MSEVTPRVLRLRQHALTQIDRITWMPAQIDLLAERAWLASGAEPWMVIRHARETEAILEGLKPAIDVDELIVGKYDLTPLAPEEEAELAFYKARTQPARPLVLGMKSHMAIDFDKLLRLGVSGIKGQIERYRSHLDLARPEALEKDAFYRACLITLNALVSYAHHYADEVEALARSTINPARVAELLEIAQIMRHVPENPARSFYEAIQSVHFVTFSLGAGTRTTLFQYGRPDRYLLPFYLRDLANGEITQAQAQELIDCLGIMLTEFTPPSLAVGWMVGGRDAAGRDVCNDLTRMFLESIQHVHLSYPDVGLCWTPETPVDILELAGRLLAQGFSHPALFNDDVISAGLAQVGLPPAEACLYQNSTCVEITPIASSNVYVASPYINLVQVLHDILGVPQLSSSKDMTGLTGYRVEKSPKSPKDFQRLVADFQGALNHVVREAIIDQNTQQATRYYHGGQPLLSCFVNDCLARGLDIDQGGARYNWIEPSFVGLANLVDSLETIKKVVFEEKILSLNELVDVLGEDYNGNESLRQMFLNRVAKYGTDDDLADSMAVQVTGWIKEEVRHYKSYLGGEVISGFFTWIMHERLGSVTAASADGRHAGFPLSAGAGAAQGCERQGPTAAVLSATKWQHTSHLGGIAVNLKFNRPRNDAEFEKRLLDVVTTYLQRGGFEVQVNVVDRSTLEAAQKAPEQYRDLVVRIGGYSDYFVRLSPEMQAEIILRSDHSI